jgi:hypothetical protein
MMKMDNSTRIEPAAAGSRDQSRLDNALAQVRHALSGLRYGQIAITVQDGVVIQIERTERTRLGRGTS